LVTKHKTGRTTHSLIQPLTLSLTHSLVNSLHSLILSAANPGDMKSMFLMENGAFLPGALILGGIVLGAYVDPTDFSSQGH